MNKNTTNEKTVSPVIDRIKIAIDMHLKNYCFVRQQDYSAPEPPQKLSPEGFLAWLAKQRKLAREVVVCYEAGCFGYEPARRMEAMGVKVLVIAPQNWDEQGKRQVNDKFDARVMCRRLSDHLDGHKHALSIVRIPSREEEQRRSVGRQRDQLRKVQRQTQAMGRSLLLRHEVVVRGQWWRGKAWVCLQKKLPAAVLAQLEHYRAVLEVCEKEAAALEAELTAEARPEERFFGEGELTHELLAREIMTQQRFQNGRQVGNYFGLCPSESTSDQSRRLGSITKHGNPRLRHLMVELAWRVFFDQPGYRGTKKWAPVLGDPRAGGSRRKKAIVALARQLAVDLWRLQTGRVQLADLGLTRESTRHQRRAAKAAPQA
jgi:transposase